MRLSPTPPPGWDERIASPLQSVGFASAARTLGHQPLFAEGDEGVGLVLLRRVPVPVLQAWTTRAKVYAHARGEAFLPALIARLQALGVSHVKLGDATWGMNAPAPPEGVVSRLVYHAFVYDVTDPEALLARTHRTIRQHIRRATAVVEVTEVRTTEDLRDYLVLAEQTQSRMRQHEQAAVYPAAYFEAIRREMVPRGQATMLLARAGEVPLAGGTFITTRRRFAQIHGCSTRNRDLTPKGGPTMVLWHAMRAAGKLGCQTLDTGAVTPTDDPAHPHYSVYRYKKLWSGRLVEVPCAELVVAPWKHRFQESLLAPMWDRLHPLYLRLFGELCGQEQRL